MGEFRKLTVELDEAATGLIDKVVGEGRFADATEALRYAMLLLSDWEREQHGDLDDLDADADRLFDEALKSGEPVEATDAFYESIRRRGRARAAALRANAG